MRFLFQQLAFTVPQVFVGDRRVGGYEATVEAIISGELERLLGDAGPGHRRGRRLVKLARSGVDGDGTTGAHSTHGAQSATDRRAGAGDLAPACRLPRPGRAPARCRRARRRIDVVPRLLGVGGRELERALQPARDPARCAATEQHVPPSAGARARRRLVGSPRVGRRPNAERAERRPVPVGALVSVNVGKPRDVSWRGRTVFTGVFKEPITGVCRARTLNLDGDGQGDLAGHGGEQRAVFVYQLDSYRYWARELERNDLVHGQFGENFTVEGLSDDEVCIGDRYRIGTAVFEVSQPRVTCYRVGIRLDDPRIPALLVSKRRPGFYLRVLQEGDVQAGDEILQIGSGPERMTVADVDALLYLPGHPREQLLRARRHPCTQSRLAGVLRRAARRGSRCRQRRARRGKPSAGVAGVPAADHRRHRAGVRLRGLDPARGPRGADPSRGPPRSVPHDPPAARRGAASGAPQLLALRAARRRLLPDHGQAGTRRRRQRVPAHASRGRRPARRRRSARNVHPRPVARAGAPDQRRHRGDSRARHAARAGGRALGS